jgi:hypothetical protein
MPDDRSQYEGERADTRNFSNIRSDTPYYRSIPRGIANVGRSFYDSLSGRGSPRDSGVNMVRRRAIARRAYRNGDR